MGAGHALFPVSIVLQQNTDHPPATEGMIITSVPAPTAVSWPLSRRHSSPST